MSKLGAAESGFVATLTTPTFAVVSGGVGALVAVAVSAQLVRLFSTGLLVAPPPDLDHFLTAVAVGAFGWVILASRTGWPVSTTSSWQNHP